MMSQRTYDKLRLLAVWWLLQTALVTVLFAIWGISIGEVNGPRGNWLGVFPPRELVDALYRPAFWGWAAGINAGLILLQAGFLIPVRRPRARKHRGVPLAISAAIAGLAATTLLLGIGCAIYGLLELLDALIDVDSDEQRLMYTVVFWGSVLLSWIIASSLIRAFLNRRLNAGDSHERALSHIAAILLKGTLIEALAVIPLDVMIRRKTDCYSFAGTMWALSLCFSVGFLLCGPAIVLPLIGRRRREWWRGRCECCGYDMSALLQSDRTIERCPECGAGWKPAATAGAADVPSHS